MAVHVLPVRPCFTDPCFAADTLKRFGLNQRGLEAELGFCAVLHTHTRRLDFHPHAYIVIPAGGVHRARREWRKLKGNYMFNLEKSVES